MAVVRCPACAADLEVADRHLAEPVACGACGEVFAVGGPPLRPARPVRRAEESDDDDESDDRPRRLRPDAGGAYLPGVFSVVVCVLSLLGLVGDVVVMLALPQMMQNNPLFFGQQPPPVEVMIGFRVWAMLWLLVVLAASFRMMAGRGHRFAVAGMIMHLIPCSGLCYLFGLPVGVWALVVLHRPEVKAGFERNDLAAVDAAQEDLNR